MDISSEKQLYGYFKWQTAVWIFEVTNNRIDISSDKQLYG